MLYTNTDDDRDDVGVLPRVAPTWIAAKTGDRSGQTCNDFHGFRRRAVPRLSLNNVHRISQ